MSPLPQVVLIALAICNQHISSQYFPGVWIDPGHPQNLKGTPSESGNTPGLYWESSSPWSECTAIEAKAIAIVAANAAAEQRRQQAERDAKDRIAARADQPKLQAALKALENMK